MTQSRNTDHRTRLSRRRLLQGMSGLTVALTAPIWKAATSFGATPKPPKRFIGVFSANGTVPGAFFPAGKAAEAPLTLGADTKILAPLSAYASKMLVLKGVDMVSTIGSNKPGGPHMKGPGALLTGGSLLRGPFTGSEGPAGYADRISLDQVIANGIGASTKYSSLELGVRMQGQEPLRYISYRGASMPNTPVDDPWQVYSRLFANAGLTPAQLSRTLADRKSVLDFVADDLGRLSKRFTSNDKARLDAHLAGVQRIEQQLTISTESCTAPTLPARIDPHALENFPAIAKLQMDLMLLALSCGMTRVATFMFANADSWQHYPWIGVDEEHHELSHSGDDDAAATEKLVKINVWHAQQIAYMLDGLAAAKDTDGSSLLDNTVLLWGNELGKGNTHTYKDIPWLLAGGAGLRTGRYLQYQSQPHNNLLLALAQLFGFSSMTSFGDPTLCTGALSGLT